MGRTVDVFYTKTRVDVLHHKSTEWFSVLEHGIRLQCQCANQAGVLERSVAAMARIASGDGQLLTVTPEQVEQSISRLTATGHVVWWREREVLWWVEMADEQRPSEPSKASDFWARIRDQVLPKLINQIRHLICERYPDLISGKPSDIGLISSDSKPDLHQTHLFRPLDRDREQDQDRDQVREKGRASAPSTRSRRKRSRTRTADVDGALITRVIECMNEHRAAVIENASGFGTDSKTQRGWVAKATAREGATFEDWALRIGHLAEAASRDSFWVPHLTLQYLHWQKNWEKWEHESAIPPRRGGRRVGHAPSNFDRPDRSFGLDEKGGESRDAC